MKYDFSDYFQKYEDLVKDIETIFAKVKNEHEGCVTCEVGCSDCCHATFDLSLIEALYLNQAFHQNIADPGIKRKILQEANKADRAAYKLKKDVYNKHQKGVDEEEIFDLVAKTKIRCPLLSEDDTCYLYSNRPITCRLYGIPLNVAGNSRTCGRSNFQEGVQYPTVHLDKVHDKLVAICQEIVENMPTMHPGLINLFVPVSMALLTEYDDDFFGIVQPEKNVSPDTNQISWDLPGGSGDDQG